MDKNAIKKFAVWARTELIARVSLKGVEYGITEDNIEDANADSVGGKVLAANEKKQRQALIAEINDKGYKQVMEEVAYTWFNRFSALRFMEVNGYLPSHVRVFTDEENNFKPQIITEAIHLDLDGLNMEKVALMKEQAIIMHPAPFNRGVELTDEVVECEKSRIFAQITNGVFVRQSILKRTFADE